MSFEPDMKLELLPGCPAESDATFDDLVLAIQKIHRLEAEIAQLRRPMRSSLEVLQRMANGLDPFDRGRFQAAMAALPHEMPKLSASVATVFDSGGGIGDRLDAARRRREAAERGIRVIDGEGAPGP